MKIGDKVYQVTSEGNIFESEISNIVYDTIDPISGVSGVAFDKRAIGKSVFDSPEAAKEKAVEIAGAYMTYDDRKQKRINDIKTMYEEIRNDKL